MKKMYAPLIRREVETWRHLRHPNIIQLYEIIVTESRVHLVRRPRPLKPRLPKVAILTCTAEVTL